MPLRNAGSPTWRVCRGPRAQGRARDQQGLRKAEVHTGAQRGGIAARAKPRGTFGDSLLHPEGTDARRARCTCSTDGKAEAQEGVGTPAN